MFTQSIIKEMNITRILDSSAIYPRTSVNASGFWKYFLKLDYWKELSFNLSMITTVYYHAYRNRITEHPEGIQDEPLQDMALQERRTRLHDTRMMRAVSIASKLGIEERHVFVEEYDDTLSPDGHFMRLLRSKRPTIVVMDSLSMFLQQFGLTYWITLLRTALQAQVLPITVEELRMGVHRDFDNALQVRRTTIEALTEHIRPEPKRERGRRKLGPIADLVESILLHTADPMTDVFPEFRSSHDVLVYISTWYEKNTRLGETLLQYDKIFAPERWITYKYKVRTMAKDALLDVIVKDFPYIAMPSDIWQPSELVDGRVVSLASLAAVRVLPDFGFENDGHQWLKVLRPRQSMK